MIQYNALINGKSVKKFERSRASFMNGVWDKFNKYAEKKGFTIEVMDSRYLGNLAWKNENGDIMELVRDGES
jgi:hypothetical protein